MTSTTEWRCFHCGDVFTDERSARLHFGRDETSIPACVIKAGAEQGLLTALREAEYAAADAWHAVADECTDASKAYYAQATRHAVALRNAEELGYERGLADGRSLTSAPAGDGDRYSAGYSQGTIDACQQQQWMQDKAWQDAVLMLVHYSTLAERTWLVGHEEAARKLAEWWDHARALADTKTAEDIAALARPRAAEGAPLATDVAELVNRIGRAEWGATDAVDADGHGKHVANSVRITAAHFDQTGPQRMQGLYVAGTETVICHVGTSPNSPAVARALAGAWNHLCDLAALQSSPAKVGSN